MTSGRGPWRHDAEFWSEDREAGVGEAFEQRGAVRVALRQLPQLRRERITIARVIAEDGSFPATGSCSAPSGFAPAAETGACSAIEVA
jgi:hypothetical protein